MTGSKHYRVAATGAVETLKAGAYRSAPGARPAHLPGRGPLRPRSRADRGLMANGFTRHCHRRTSRRARLSNRRTNTRPPARRRTRLLDFRPSWRGEERKETVVADEVRHCMDHDRIHQAYRWYVREKRSSELEGSPRRSSAPRIDYLCNAAYSRLPRTQQAEWKLLE